MNDQFRALDCFIQAIGSKYHLFEFKALPLVYFVLALTIDQINKVFFKQLLLVSTHMIIELI